MQLSSGSHIPDGLLAANVLLSEKPRLGVPSRNLALHPGISEANCTAAIGLRASQSLNRVQSRYTGKERDTESGLDYFGARYYASSMGRFMSPDPMMASAHASDPQTWNRYAYVLNNPLRMVDPDGLEASAGCASDKKCSITVKINVIYDSDANKGKGLTQKQKDDFKATQLDKAQKEVITHLTDHGIIA